MENKYIILVSLGLALVDPIRLGFLSFISNYGVILLSLVGIVVGFIMIPAWLKILLMFLILAVFNKPIFSGLKLAYEGVTGFFTSPVFLSSTLNSLFATNPDSEKLLEPVITKP